MEKIDSNILRFLAILGVWFLLLSAAPRAWSEERILHLYSSDKPEPDLESLLFLSAGVELTRAGYTSTRAETGSDYILLAEYGPEGEALLVRYRLVRSSRPDLPLAEEEALFRVDQTLDRQVSRILRSLLESAGLEARPVPEAEIEGIFPAFPAAPSGTEVREAPAPVVEAGTAAAREEVAPPAESGSPSLPALPAPEPGGGRKPRAAEFGVSVSALGLMLFGKATEYFHYGAGAGVSAGFSWPRPERVFSAGARLSALRVFNDPGVTGGPFSFFSGGFGLGLGTGTGHPYHVGAVASGGAAVLRVSGDGGALAKTVPYADLGINLRLPAGRRLRLGGELRLLFLFDADVLILGAAPALTMSLEL